MIIFVYVRFDLHKNTTFILVMGTSADSELDRLLSQFEDVRSPHLLSILLALTSTWAQQIERVRWGLDFSVQSLEAKTGHSSFNFKGIRPLPPEKLALQKDMAVTLDTLKGVHRASTHLEEIFGHLLGSLDVLDRLQHESASGKQHLARQIKSAIRQRQSQTNAQAAQISGLIARVDAQWNIVSSLVSRHNNELNLGMARDSRNDSVLMRRIAGVTTIFLPATFMATFFSMMFFHTEGNGNLRVNSTIWVYFVCTIALSVLIVLFFRYSELWQRWFGYSLRNFSVRTTSDEEKAKVA